MTTTARRRIRRLCAGLAALCLGLGAVACSSDGGGTGGTTSAEGSSAAPSTAEPAATSDGGTSDGGTASAGSVMVMVLNDGVAEVVDEGTSPASILPEDLEALLAEQTGIDPDVAPECEGTLEYMPEATVTCTAETTLEGLPGIQELTVMPVRLPAGFESEGRPGLLISLGGPLAPEAAAVVTDQGHQLVGIGQGSMFGSVELSAEELAEVAESTINDENGYAPLDAPMVVESCEGSLPAGSREPVTCTVAFAHDPEETFSAQTMGVSYLGEGGLLIALDMAEAAANG